MSEFADFEEIVLGYDAFAGDFGMPQDRVLTNKMVTAKYVHKNCNICGGDIEKGERHRSQSEIFDGALMAFRWCWACCVAMAKSYDNDNGDDICARQDIYRAKPFTYE